MTITSVFEYYFCGDRNMFNKSIAVLSVVSLYTKLTVRVLAMCTEELLCDATSVFLCTSIITTIAGMAIFNCVIYMCSLVLIMHVLYRY